MTTKALVVDDSKVARMMMKKVLSSIRPDWEIAEASNGNEALEVLESTPCQVFFIDVNMPGMDGTELAGILKKDHPDTPMTLVTANIQESVRNQAADLGIGVIGKPLKEEKLEGYLTEAGLS